MHTKYSNLYSATQSARLLIFLVINCFVINLAFASEPPAIQTVNVAKLIDQSIPGQQLQNDLRSDVTKVEALQKRLATELSSLEREIKQSESTLTASAKERKIQAFAERRKEALRQVEDAREKLGIKERDGLSELVKALREHIREYGSKNNIPLIIEDDPRVLAYRSGRLDITDKVLAFINEREVSGKR